MALRPLTLIGIIVSIVTGTALGVVVHLKMKHEAPSEPELTLTDALRQVSRNYVEDISEEELLGHAIEGMMRTLDTHSTYLDATALDALQANTTGQFGGVGIELGLVDGYFTIIAPIDDTPAQRAGIRAGDRITKVNGKSVKGKKLVELVEILRGAPGTEVKLSIKRNHINATIEFELQRAVVAIASVKSRMLEPGYGYLRIAQFQSTTGKDVEEALEALKNSGELNGLVIDLRNNPGGTLQASVQVADQFLEQGLIVYTEGRLKSSHAKYRATRGDVLDGLPIVVLINGGSASASEILAGALRDHDRAMLIGGTSYGKGSVQSVLPLDKRRAIKLTTAYYYTPNGQSIHDVGIEPDILFEGEDELLFDTAVQHLKQLAQADSDTLKLASKKVR